MVVELTVLIDIVVKILQLAVIIGGGGMLLYKGGRFVQRLDQTMTAQAADIKELKDETKKVTEVVTKIAVQDERLTSHDRRIQLMEDRWEELRRGEGFVLPLVKSGGIS